MTERIGALEVEVNATRTELEATQTELEAIQTELEATQTRLNTQLSLSQDHRLFFFSTAMPRSKGSHSAASKEAKSLYGSQCLFCGSDEGVTLAHLVAGNPDVDYSAFGPPKYLPNFDYRSVRNFIPLCGTRGQKDTCHDEFDNYFIGVVPVPVGGGANQCKLLCLRPNFPKYRELNNKTISFRNPHPYRRILAWRNRKCLLEHGRLRSDGDIQNALRACDLSEIANSICDGDNNNDDADTDYVDPDYEDGMPVKSVESAGLSRGQT